MTGPEHYRKAEQYAVGAARGDVPLANVQVLVGLAHAHATLALAAATIDVTFIADRLRDSETPADEWERDWTAATS